MAGSATTHEHVRRMLKEIHERYTQRLTLRMLASTLQRQSAYLGRLFRDEVGVTVHEYVTRARMIFGAAQVRSGVKIEAVALELGYRSKKNFYRQFYRRFGTTPEAYRQEHDVTRSGGGRAAARPSRTAVMDARPGLTDGGGHHSLPRLLAQQIVAALVGQRLAMLATDGSGCCVAANEAAMSMTGYAVEELRGMPAQRLFPEGDDCTGGSRLQVLLPVSSSVPANALLRTRVGSCVHVHLTSAENLLATSEATGMRHQNVLRGAASA